VTKSTSKAGRNAGTDDDALLGEASDPAADDLLGAIEEVSESGAGGTVRTERLNSERKWEFCAEDDAGMFSLRDIHDAWGGGTFRFTVRNHKRQYQHSSRRVLAGEPRSPRSAAAPSAPAQDAGGVDPVRIIKEALAEQTKQIVAVLAHRPAVPSLTERVAELTALRDLVMPAAAPANGGASQALEMIKLAREFAAEGETDGWSILARALEKFSEPAAAMLTRAAQSRGTPAAAPARVPAPAAAPAINGTPRPMPAAKNKTDLAGFLQLLIDRAEAKADPDLWAAALVDIVPPEELADFVRHDDPLSEMALLDPRVTLHAEWFGAVLDLLREHFAADATGTGTETDADSDARATS